MKYGIILHSGSRAVAASLTISENAVVEAVHGVLQPESTSVWTKAAKPQSEMTPVLPYAW